MAEGCQLIADIGATHSRLAIVDNAGWRSETFPTTEYTSAADLLEVAAVRLGYTQLAGCCLAVAGPVLAGRATITNGHLEFVEAELAALLGCPVKVVNDFYAVACGIPAFTELLQLGGGAESGGASGSAKSGAGQVKVVLGPGSGLGMGILIPDQGGWQVLPSEGGHADLAPGNPLEQEILSLLQAKHGSVCWETVLSGPGLVNLYEVVCQLWGSEPQAATPEWISAQGVAAIEPICHQTLDLFFGLLGAAAGNLALTVCAYGGVYIGGGIVPALQDFAATSALRRRFEERCGLAGFTKDIPLYLILDEHPGLIGALACLRSDMRVDIKSDPGSEVEKELQEQSRGA
ncbi:MAG: glucokinase [Gammaproteobacteria bacterium]|nr:glucokinase [Gammaproteobacteria bacterium]